MKTSVWTRVGRHLGPRPAGRGHRPDVAIHDRRRQRTGPSGQPRASALSLSRDPPRPYLRRPGSRGFRARRDESRGDWRGVSLGVNGRGSHIIHPHFRGDRLRVRDDEGEQREDERSQGCSGQDSRRVGEPRPGTEDREGRDHGERRSRIHGASSDGQRLAGTPVRPSASRSFRGVAICRVVTSRHDRDQSDIGALGGGGACRTLGGCGRYLVGRYLDIRLKQADGTRLFCRDVVTPVSQP